MSITPREPTLATLLIDAIQSRLVDFRVMLPAKIAKYNSKDGTVDVDILIKDQKPQPDGTVKLATFPTIQDVPVAWTRCGKGWLTLPLAAGDTGEVVFADRSLSNWAGSGKGEVVDPKDLGMHNLSGAVFRPGLTPTTSPIDSPDTDNVVLHTETKLCLGEKNLSDDFYLALAKKVKTELDKLPAPDHTHTVAIPSGTAASTATSGTPSALFVSTTTATTKVKGK